ncbi:hypothetical protein J7T55_005841 [Diaporthe amygdali]|uniref:uncharacterized protein n=1 Tax=Phomopsis amygdali TaxID=1214568 RepID=UPI0022FED2F0|nr:uncharacterized protein J7T55_005841 [Diaporthe amygdali]KAJ0124503.1 hypothetical protein J7T55_005841 [Diaporthe amygdali]
MEELGASESVEEGTLRSPRIKNLILFSSPLFGVQLAWTIQQVYGLGLLGHVKPYLSSLGFSATQLPFLILSGPLAGLIAPPVFAILSDTCQSRLGKRKPFIFGGGAAVVLSLLLLARAKELGELLSTSFSAAGVNTLLAKTIATISIYCLNFAMQPLYLGIRAWSVDFFLPHQQPVISLWSSRFMSLGSLFVAFVGYGSQKPSFRIYLQSHDMFVVPNSLPGSLGFQFYNIAADRDNYSYVYEVYEANTSLNPNAAIARVSLMFYVAMFATNLAVPYLWRFSAKESSESSLSENEGNGNHSHHTRGDHVLLQTWRICLIILAIWLLGLSLSSSRPLAVSIIFAATGVLFAIANWVPYSLISQEISSRSKLKHECEGVDHELEHEDSGSDTARLLAIHNMSITVPQILFSLASATLLSILGRLGTPLDVSWIFLMSIPAAVLSAWLV